MENIEKIIIIGCGGHAKSVCDTLLALPELYEVVGFVDRVENVNFSYQGIAVIGTDDDLQKIYAEGVHCAALGIGYLGKDTVRNHIVEKLQKAGFILPAIVDPTASVAQTAKVGEGTFVGKRAVVNTDARIGRYCIINSCSLIEHDCNIGNFTHVAVSACVCGGVSIGEGCLVGANATIIQGMEVTAYSIIPAGAVVRRSNKIENKDKNMKSAVLPGGGV